MNSLLTLAALLGVAGCADRGPPPGVFDGIDAQIGHMDAQEGAHLQAIRSAASLPAVLTEAAAHRDHISGEFESIRAGIDTPRPGSTNCVAHVGGVESARDDDLRIQSARQRPVECCTVVCAIEQHGFGPFRKGGVKGARQPEGFPDSRPLRRVPTVYLRHIQARGAYYGFDGHR